MGGWALKAFAFVVGLVLLLLAVSTAALVAPHAGLDASRDAIWTMAIGSAVASIPLLVVPFSMRAFRACGSIALVALGSGFLWLAFGPLSLANARAGDLQTAQIAAIGFFMLLVARIASAWIRRRRRSGP